MAIHIFYAEAVCPKCKLDLYDRLFRRVMDGAGSYFELECDCGVLLSAESEPVPLFEVEVIAPHKFNAGS